MIQLVRVTVLKTNKRLKTAAYSGKTFKVAKPFVTTTKMVEQEHIDNAKL